MNEEATYTTAPNLLVRTTRTASVAVVAPSGELDLATVPLLEVVLDELELTSIRRVVLDLGALSFMDATGLRQVLKLHSRCVERAVALTIKPGPRSVQRIFELTHCDEMLPFAT